MSGKKNQMTILSFQNPDDAVLALPSSLLYEISEELGHNLLSNIVYVQNSKHRDDLVRFQEHFTFLKNKIIDALMLMYNYW